MWSGSVGLRVAGLPRALHNALPVLRHVPVCKWEPGVPRESIVPDSESSGKVASKPKPKLQKTQSAAMATSTIQEAR